MLCGKQESPLAFNSLVDDSFTEVSARMPLWGEGVSPSPHPTPSLELVIIWREDKSYWGDICTQKHFPTHCTY